MSKWKSTKDENPDFKCRKCGSNEIQYYCSDGDYEDYRYKCECGYSWWVEGSDY